MKDWGTHFETAGSAALERTLWVPMPNRHDGETYQAMMAEPDAATLFAGWVLLVQVASRCPVRGVLVKDSGVPHDARSLAARTRGRVEWFERALAYFVGCGWLEEVQTELGPDGRMRAPRLQEARRGPTRPPRALPAEPEEPLPLGLVSATAPSRAAILGFAQAHAMPAEAALAFFEHFARLGWQDRFGRPVKSWRGRLRRWVSDWQQRENAEREARESRPAVPCVIGPARAIVPIPQINPATPASGDPIGQMREAVRLAGRKDSACRSAS